MVITGHLRHVFHHIEEKQDTPLWIEEEIKFKRTDWRDVFGCYCNSFVHRACGLAWSNKDCYTTSAKITHQLLLLGELTL